MATAKQIEANRLNALKSSGPKTDEGKAASRFNAVTHGLSARMPEALIGRKGYDDVEKLKKKWRPELQPEDDAQEALFDTVVVEAVRVDRCQRTFFALCKQHGERARTQWDDDRRRDADELAAGLSRNPRVVASRLEKTPHGCDIKLDLWNGLAASLECHQTWTDPQRSLALDLLGVHAELRDAGTAIDAPGGDELAKRRAVVSSEVARLKVVRDRMTSDDQAERAMAEQTLGVEFTKPVERLDRYERAAVRRQNSAWKRLNEAKRAEPVAAAPVPKPAPVESRSPAPVPPPVKAAEPVKPVNPPAPAQSRPVEPTRQIDPAAGMNRHQRRRIAALERRAS